VKKPVYDNNAYQHGFLRSSSLSAISERDCSCSLVDLSLSESVWFIFGGEGAVSTELIWNRTATPQKTQDSFAGLDFGSEAEKERRHSGQVRMM
jgi:hypothetical protein